MCGPMMSLLLTLWSLKVGEKLRRKGRRLRKEGENYGGGGKLGVCMVFNGRVLC